MKTLKSLLEIGLCAILLISCQKEKKENLPGSVTFKFQTDNALNLKSSKVEPIASAIIVTIEKNEGGVVYNKEKLTLSYLNGSYLSKGLDLLEGNYKLTEFLVTDVNNKIIYATPKQGSELANLVDKPLPLNFNAYSNIGSILVPEVIPTDSSSLDDLGYVGFSFNVTGIKFLITVLSKYENGEYYGVDSCDLSAEPMSSYSPEGWSPEKYNFKLGASSEVNSITLKKDTAGYVLTVCRKNFNSWIDTLSWDQLMSYSTTPYYVILSPILGPSIWLREFFPSFTPMSVIPSMTVKPGATIYVDNGRGKLDKIQSTTINLPYMEYSRVRLVQIYGDVDKITTLSHSGGGKWGKTGISIGEIKNATSLEELSFSGCGIEVDLMNNYSLKKIFLSDCSTALMSFRNLINLEELSIWNSSMDTIDIQASNDLKQLRMDGTIPVKFGLNPNLKNITISYYYRLPTGVGLSRLLEDLLVSVRSSPRNGEFSIIIPFPTLPALTNEGLLAGKALKTEYNWTFSSMSSMWDF